MRRVTPGASQRFVVATEELETGAPVVSVMGEVDLATAPALERTLAEVADEGTGEVIVDLTACSFLDSNGLRALNSVRPAIVLSNPNVLRIFQLTKFDKVFEIYPTLDAALNRNGNGNANGNGNGNGNGNA